MLRLPKDFADDIYEQCRAEFPNEACGLLAGRDGIAQRLFRMTNAERSPVIYRMDPKEQLRAFNEIEEGGLELVSIYHSHTRSAAYPSNTDVSWAYYPEAVYLIVSLEDPEAPHMRGFRIEGGRVDEVPVAIAG
ncbi:MAG TPA: M67 family metallopeptidase [Actinomycetota bacterium]|nr:M67 family metallopeptidase [Actinomycetota bacterium]